jgi:hypothetical protein
MIFEPAFAARLRSREQEALMGESDLLRAIFSSWRRIVGGDTTSKNYQQRKYLNQLYWVKVRSWEFYLAASSLVGE